MAISFERFHCTYVCRKTIFADPDADEEELATALVTIAMRDDQLCLVNKPGGQSISDIQFNDCLKLALNRQKSICKLITSILETEAKK